MNILIVERTVEPAGAVINLLNTAAALRKFGHRIKIATVFVAEIPDLPSFAKRSPRLYGDRSEGNSSRSSQETEQGALRRTSPPHTTDFDYQTPPKWVVNLCRRNRLALTFLGPVFLFGVVLKSATWADVLNPNTFPTHWIASVVGLIKRRPIVWSCHEPYIHINLKDTRKVGWITFLVSLIARGPWGRLFVKRIDQISAVSRRCKSWVDKRYGKTSFVNYPGVDFDYYSRGDPQAAVRKFGLEGKFVLLSIGVFAPMKNQEVLIKMMALLREKIPEAILLLVGEGPMEDYLKRYASGLGVSERVRFLGTLYDESKNKLDLCAAADIFLFPAVGQTWGMAPFEALCSGTPVIVSDDCGAAEAVRKERVGLVVPPTAEAFAEAVLELYKKPELRREFGHRGEEFVKKNLTWERYARRLESNFQLSISNFQ